MIRAGVARVTVGAVALALAITQPAAPARAARSPFARVGVPAGSGSGEPTLSRAPDGDVLLSWLEKRTANSMALQLSHWRSGTWSRPRTVVVDDSLFVNWADVPGVFALTGDTLVAWWLRRTAGGAYDYAVRAARSADGGGTWSATLPVHGDAPVGEHGFVSLVAWPAGGAAFVWLDGRRMAGSSGHEGDMTLRHAVLGSDGSLGGETLLDARTCECCQTGATATRDAVVVVYRDRSEREVRDVYTVRWQDGKWSDPRPVAVDDWEIAGCPVNGPALAALGDTLAVAWYTAPRDTARVQVCFSNDAGRTFGRVIRVDEGDPTGRADVVMPDDGGAIVCWIEGTRGVARIRVRRVAPDGRLGEAITVADTSPARRAGFPRIELAGDRLICAWTDPERSTRVRTTVARLSAIPR